MKQKKSSNSHVLAVVMSKSTAIPESVKKCAAALKAASSDLEKITGLFGVVRLVKSPECNLNAKELLFDSIGGACLKRMLEAADSIAESSGCPPHVYRSVALSILSAFCAEKELARHQGVVGTLPAILDIIQKSDAEDDCDDDNLIVVSEAYQCLLRACVYSEGKKILLESGALKKLTDVYANQSFKSEDALQIIVSLCETNDTDTWKKESPELLNYLLGKVASDYESEEGKRKYELCSVLYVLLKSGGSILESSLTTEVWPQGIRKGLSDTLSSKIGKDQRDPALKLSSVMVDLLGVEWALTDCEKPKQFLLLLIHLCSVEVRMQLEDKNFDVLLKSAELTKACFIVLEQSVAYIATDVLDLEQKEKQQLYTALKGSFSAVLNTLKKMLMKSSRNSKPPSHEEFSFTVAMIRALAAWLAQDSTAMKTTVFEVLPFILTVANDSFYSYRSWYISEKVKTPKSKASGSAANDVEDKPENKPADILRLLLPALCHFTVDEKGREIMLKSKQDDVLVECFSFHWSIVNYKPPPPPKSERLKMKNKPEAELPESIVEAMKESRTAMISMCNIFMNIIVLETKIVETSETFTSLLKFILNNLTDLKRSEENLVLHANMAVLGLLLLKSQPNTVKKNDFSICRYFQSTIRFLWDAFYVDESNDPNLLVVAMDYKRYWIELMELWFLGMQTISVILTHIPWISEFIMETGWAEGIVQTLRKVRVGTLPTNTRHAYEDFLLHLCKTNSSVIPVLQDLDILTVCRNHLFMELGKFIFGD